MHAALRIAANKPRGTYAKVYCGLQAPTLANAAIETRRDVCRTPVEAFQRVLHLPALLETTWTPPLLLEWHPEMPTAAIVIDNTKVTFVLSARKWAAPMEAEWQR